MNSTVKFTLSLDEVRQILTMGGTVTYPHGSGEWCLDPEHRKYYYMECDYIPVVTVSRHDKRWGAVTADNVGFIVDVTHGVPLDVHVPEGL